MSYMLNSGKIGVAIVNPVKLQIYDPMKGSSVIRASWQIEYMSLRIRE